MAAKRLFSNNAVSLLNAPINASATTLQVIPGHGAMFPTPQANEFFCVTLEDQAASIREIIHVTARNGDTFTIARGQEGTTARSWGASQGNDTLVDHRITAGTLYYLKDEFVDTPADLSYSNPDFPALVSYKTALDYLLALDPAEPPDLNAINSAIQQLQAAQAALLGRVAATEGDVAALQGDVTQLQTDLAANNDYSNAAFPNLTTYKLALDYLLDPDYYTGLQAAITEILERLQAIENAGNDYQNPSFPELTNYNLALDYLLQGNAVSGGQVIDADITTAVVGNKTNITLESSYKPFSTAVYVGGVRQKRGVDFYESGDMQLQLQFALTPQMIADGQNVVVDYIVA